MLICWCEHFVFVPPMDGINNFPFNSIIDHVSPTCLQMLYVHSFSMHPWSINVYLLRQRCDYTLKISKRNFTSSAESGNSHKYHVNTITVPCNIKASTSTLLPLFDKRVSVFEANFNNLCPLSVAKWLKMQICLFHKRFVKTITYLRLKILLNCVMLFY